MDYDVQRVKFSDIHFTWIGIAILRGKPNTFSSLRRSQISFLAKRKKRERKRKTDQHWEFFFLFHSNTHRYKNAALLSHCLTTLPQPLVLFMPLHSTTESAFCSSPTQKRNFILTKCWTLRQSVRTMCKQGRPQLVGNPSNKEWAQGGYPYQKSDRDIDKTAWGL